MPGKLYKTITMICCDDYGNKVISKNEIITLIKENKTKQSNMLEYTLVYKSKIVTFIERKVIMEYSLKELK